MTYVKECFSPFLFAFRNRIDPMILYKFLENDVDINAMRYVRKLIDFKIIIILNIEAEVVVTL